MYELINSIDEIIKNVQVYLQILKEVEEGKIITPPVIERFHNFYYWYYLPDVDIFVPNNFLGYKNSAEEVYGPGKNEAKAKEARLRLEQFFDPIDEKEYKTYCIKLLEFVHKYKPHIKVPLKNIYEPNEISNNLFTKDKLDVKIDIPKYYYSNSQNSGVKAKTNLSASNNLLATKTTSQKSISGDKLGVINEAFRLILPVLAKYICEILIGEYKNNWWSKVLEMLKDENTKRKLPKECSNNNDECIERLDIPACLNIIESGWYEVFKNKMDDRQRTWAHALRDIRNYYEAHYTSKTIKTSSVEDISLELAIMIRFMQPIDTNVAEQISEIKRDFENKYKK
jgi:hypothetical protein